MCGICGYVSRKNITVEELKKMIFAGEIKDSKTVAGLLAYALQCEKQE